MTESKMLGSPRTQHCSPIELIEPIVTPEVNQVIGRVIREPTSEMERFVNDPRISRRERQARKRLMQHLDA